MWILYCLGASICVALLSHLFIFNEWLGGTYFIGIRDGMSQMLPFKQLLYDNYTSGAFFYSDIFGMGGGIYSQLGYYYSTSIVFLLTVLVTYGLETMGIIGHPDLSYWADAVLFVSVIRMVIIMFVTTIYIRYLGFQTKFAFIGAVLYATSTIYFRHVVYWEFFADAMIWLPLLLLGIERIIRGKTNTLWIIAVAISMIDNFYFAYVNFIIAIIYIVFRNLFRFDTDVRTLTKQGWNYVLGGLVGFGLSAFSFIPSVYGFLQNDRPVFSEAIALFEHPDNPLLNGRIIVIPAIVIGSMWFFSMYRSKVFRMFSLLTLTMCILHFIPLAASIFNGFSAPQYRWEYALLLIGGVLVTYVLSHIRRAPRSSIYAGIIGIVLSYTYFYLQDEDISLFTSEVDYLLIPAILTVLTLSLFLWKRSNVINYVLMGTIICTSIWIANGFQSEKVTFAGTDEEVTKEWATSDVYNGADQKELIDLLHVREKDPLMRIDWMIPERNNTPLVQQFRGFSAYSSILNKHLLHFYWHDAMIDMGRESVSRYGTLGDRTNLYSLLYGKYVIKELDDETIPYGFEEVAEIGSYVAYENTHSLPYARTTDRVYTEEVLREAHPIEKERAMLDGVILNDRHSNRGIDHLRAEQVDNIEIEPRGGTYENDLLHVTEEDGGIDLMLDESLDHDGDYYVSFYMKRQDKDEEYSLFVNEYETSRKKNSSIYRTGLDEVVIRIPAEQTISIRVPEGTYELNELEVHVEEYERLVEEVERYEKEEEAVVTMDRQDVHINIDNDDNDRYIVLPIPYEKGWKADVNGKREDVLQANYSFMAIPIHDGENDINLSYLPPYFLVTSAISLSSLIGLSIMVNVRRNRR